MALAVGATLATLGVCEAAARWWLPPPRYHREPVEFHPELGFHGIPDFREEVDGESGRFIFALNSDGFRGRDLPAGVPSDAARVAFIGDSFLVGQALAEPQLVTSLVEEGLGAQGREVELYNLATVDFGTAQELMVLQRYARPLEPDAIVLFVYPANDLINNSMLLAGRSSVSAGDPIRPYLVPDPGGELAIHYLHPFRAKLRSSSRLFAALERRVLASRGESSAGEDQLTRLREGRAPREDLEIFRHHRDPGDPWTKAWDASFGLLRAFRAECDAMGARLLVVVVPSVYQVVRNAKGIGLDILARMAHGRPLDALLDWDLPERRLAAFFEREGMAGRLLLAPLREAAATGARVYGRDEHLSARGHEIAAASVLEWLAGHAIPAQGASLDAPDRPVRLLPGGAAARSFLDFRADPQLDHLGDGWISWAPPGAHASPGWVVGPSALAVLAPGSGDLVLRGSAPQEASYPIDGTVAIVGARPFGFRIEGPGRFAFRFPVRTPGRVSAPTAEGHLALLLSYREARGSGAAGSWLVVEALGFDAAKASRVDPSSAPTPSPVLYGSEP
jgi:hypothetical protein